MPRDIEEFLKMAAKRRQQQKQQQQQAPQPTPPPVHPSAAQTPPARPAPPPIEAQVVEAAVHEKKPRQPVRQRSQSVQESVDSHIDTSDIAEHASHLGEKIGHVDEQVQARLNQKFDHNVGTLADLHGKSVQEETTSVSEQDVSQAAQNLMNLLKDGQNIRNAIILNEVLKRPDFD